MDEKTEKAILYTALGGMLGAVACGVAMVVGAVSNTGWLFGIGGVGLLVVAMLGPVMAFAALVDVIAEGDSDVR